MLQVVTGSTGLDDFEWGVTLFANTPDDLKEVVYTMRFDEASAIYADFGPFWTGMVAWSRTRSSPSRPLGDRHLNDPQALVASVIYIRSLQGASCCATNVVEHR